MFQGFKRNRRLLAYVQNHNPVFCTFLNSTKSFHRVNYCKLFKLLVKRELPLLIIRVLANFYMNNLVRVSWGGAMTDYFTALNGVKQGAVFKSYSLLRVCWLSLLILSKAGVGCFIYTLWAHLHTRMTFWHLPLLRCANFSLYVKIMPSNIASPSMHLNPNVWLSYLRIVATLSKRLMIVFFIHRRHRWLTLFNRLLILAIWSIRFGWRRRYYNQETFFSRTS